MRTGEYIRTFTGRQFWPLDPRADEVEIKDIAHALSNMCRFNGHTKRFYSVAEHCVRVADLFRVEGKFGYPGLLALLHDAAEAYLVDLPRPVKHSGALGRLFCEAEARVAAAVDRAFGLDVARAECGPKFQRALEVADKALLQVEKLVLTSTPKDSCVYLESVVTLAKVAEEEGLGLPPMFFRDVVRMEIDGWEPPRAEYLFLERFREMPAVRRYQVVATDAGVAR